MRKKFFKGIAIGILSSTLIFTGACSLLQPADENKLPESPSVTQAEDITKPEEEKNSEAGSLLNPNSGTAEAASGLIDNKADYIMRLIKNYYLYDVTEEDYQEAIYRALMNACNDPYSCYYTPEEYKAMMESSTGRYCGIGCLVSQDVRTMLITIVRPFAGSPAEKAGILAGDIVYKVDGEEVAGQDINLVVTKMKGEENTKVQITVYRNGEYIDCEVTRAFIEVETVTAEKLVEDGHKIGLITVTEFDEVTEKQFMDVLDDLKSWGMEGLVVDLRDNPGGIVDSVVAMLDPLLPEGLTVYMKDKYGRQENYTSDAAMYDIPMSVIINGNSASASEIFAGAVQDYEVGTLVGTQSFGKGIVQSIIPLNDGSAVKMTIADYYTPLGRNIHGVGITPDVEVELPEGKTASTVTREEDTQLAAAVQVVLDEIGQ